MQIFPPSKPLDFPLTRHDICQIVKISKSTLRRWVESGKIPETNMEMIGAQWQNVYYKDDIVDLLKAMQKMTYADGYPKYVYLEEIDFDNDLLISINFPSGYLLEIK